MKTISATRRSPAPLHRVLARLEDPQLWNHAAAEAELAGSVEAGLHVRTSAPLPVDQVPDQAQRFVPASARIEQDFSLPATAADATEARAEQTTTVPGVPLEVAAVIDFREDGTAGGAGTDTGDGTGTAAGSGTEITVTAEITSSVPFLGSAIEAAIAPSIERVLTKRLEEIADL